jgi:hypothetical protein
MFVSKDTQVSFAAFMGWPLGLAAVFLALYVGACVVIDPFNLYHAISPARYISTDPLFSKRAIARSPMHDSFFAGCSMNEEFSTADFNRIFDAKFGNLTFGAATSFEQLNMLKQLPSKHFKYLMMELYFDSYTEDTRATHYQGYPLYLYDENPYNDIEAYLFCNAFLLKELYRAYYWNFRGIDKDPGGVRVNVDGFFSWEALKHWDAGSVRETISRAWTLQGKPLRLSSGNFRAILEFAAPRFEHILLYFPPVHADLLRAPLGGSAEENLKNYTNWKKQMIKIAARHPNVLLIDYQTINAYTVRDENYWYANHFRANLRQMILDDFASWIHHHRMVHTDFGQLADRAYGQRLSSQSLYFPEAFKKKTE